MGLVENLASENISLEGKKKFLLTAQEHEEFGWVLHASKEEYAVPMLKHISNSKKVPDLRFKHPYGYYEIPVKTEDLKRDSKIPSKVFFVEDTHEAFSGKRSEADATFNPETGHSYVRKDDFTPFRRIENWLGLSANSDTIQEKSIEHEIRHSLFRQNTQGPYGGGIANIDEGFAQATLFNNFDNTTGWVEIQYGGYHENYHNPKRVAAYCEIFQIIQASGNNDVEVVKKMEKNEWWANSHDLWDLDDNRIRSNVLKEIGITETEAHRLLETSMKRKETEIVEFRFGVLQAVVDFLERKGSMPKIDWGKTNEER